MQTEIARRHDIFLGLGSLVKLWAYQIFWQIVSYMPFKITLSFECEQTVKKKNKSLLVWHITWQRILRIFVSQSKHAI